MSDEIRLSCGDFRELWDGIADGEKIPLLVTGDSMYPFLINGKSRVLLQKPGASSFHKGQILLFSRPDGSYTLHRVLKVLDGGRLVMNGDSQTRCEVIPCESVCAVAAEIARNGQFRNADSLSLRFLAAVWMTLLPCRGLIFRLGHRVRQELSRGKDRK